MSKWNLKELFAKTVCAQAGSVIAAAVCFAGLLPVFLLGAALVPEGWFLKGLLTLAPVAGLLLFRKWSESESEVRSMMGVFLLTVVRLRRDLLFVIAPVRVASLRR